MPRPVLVLIATEFNLDKDDSAMPKLPQAKSAAGDLPVRIENPLVVMFEGPEKKVICRIHVQPGYTHKMFGLLVCDLVRHIAGAFKVDESDVWEWVDKERYRPTSPITRPS